MEEIIADKVSGITIAPADVEALLDLARTVRIMQDYMNDQTAHGIAQLASVVLKVANAMASTELVDVIERGLQDPQLDKALLDPPAVSLSGLLRQMKEDDLQKGLGVVLELLKAIGRATEE